MWQPLFLTCFAALVLAQIVLLFQFGKIVKGARRKEKRLKEESLKKKATDRYIKNLHRQVEGDIEYYI